jgi:hypothetical protein
VFKSCLLGRREDLPPNRADWLLIIEMLPPKRGEGLVVDRLPPKRGERDKSCRRRSPRNSRWSEYDAAE